MLELNYIENDQEYSIKGISAFLKLLSWRHKLSFFEVHYCIPENVEYLCIRNGVFSSWWIQFFAGFDTIIVLDHCEFKNNRKDEESSLYFQNGNIELESVIFEGEWRVDFKECDDIDLNLTETKNRVKLACSSFKSKVKIKGNGRNYILSCFGVSNLEIQAIRHIFVYLNRVQNLKMENSEMESMGTGTVKNSIFLNHSVLKGEELDFSSLLTFVLNDSKVIGKRIWLKKQKFFPTSSSDEIILEDKDFEVECFRKNLPWLNKKMQLLSILKGLSQMLEEQIEETTRGIAIERSIKVNELREELLKREWQLSGLDDHIKKCFSKQTVRKLTNKKKGS